jgi:hypothetical protein
MANVGTTLLLAGALTASANQAFADNRPQHGARPAQTLAANRADRPITAITKDGKPIQVEMSVPALKTGTYSADGFQRSLKGGEQMAALQVFSQYTEADIPKNIDKIQKEIADKIGAGIPLGTMTGGKPDYAKPGVNFGNVTVTKVSDVIGGKVILQQAAPAAKGPAPAPRPGA